MSNVEKLNILGIRSFGSEASDGQTIEFKSPVTLILGANGCGKTTIIECLKYAITGELPPGSNPGQKFVHDPKIAKSAETMGRIKLRVTNIHGQKLICTRPVKCLRKQNKQLQFSALQSTIHGVDPETGEEVTTTNRCVDVNMQMCNAMGVSKAIINNVIFCHQEDASWPLDESKKLKEKFDAIFGTTEYNRAVDKIIKMAKGYNDEIKSKSSELVVVRKFKTDAESKQLECNEAELKHQTIKSKIDDIENQLKPIKIRLTKIQEIEYNYSNLYKKKIEFETKLKHFDEQETRYEQQIKKIFEGSSAMLESEISSFKHDFQMKKNDLVEFNSNLSILKTQEKTILSNLSDLDKRRSTLSYKKQQEQELIAERVEKIKDLCSKLGINSDFDSQSSDESVSEIQKNIKLYLNKEEKRVQNLSKAHDIEDKEEQKIIDKHRESKASIESEIQSKEKQIEIIARDAEKLEAEIKLVEKSAQKLKVLSEQVEKINKEIDEMSQRINLDQMKQNIDHKKIKRDELQQNLDKVDEQLTFLNSISKLSSEITLNKQHLEARENEVKRVKNKHSSNLKMLFKNNIPTNNFKRNIETLSQKLQSEIKNMESNIRKCVTKHTQFETNRVNLRDEINKLKKENAENREEIYNNCEGSDYADVVSKLKEKIDKMQMDYGAAKSSEALYKKYIYQMESEPCCPLCHKDMDGSEVSNLTGELADEISRLPQKIQKCETDLKKYQTKYEKLLTLQPMVERLDFLEKEIPKRNEILKRIETQLKEIKDETENLELTQLEPNANLQIVNSLIGDMSLLDEACKDIERFEKEIQTLTAQLPATQTTMTLDEAQFEKTTIAAELKNERIQIDDIEKKYLCYVDKLNSLKEQRNKYKESQIKLQESIQALSQKKKRLIEMQEEARVTTSEKAQAESKLPQIKRELSEALNKKEKIQQNNRNILEIAKVALNKMDNSNSEIIKLNNQLNEFLEQDISGQIEQVKASLLRYKNDRDVKEKEIETITQKIENLKDEIALQEINERDLLDNRELKKIIRDRNHVQEQYDILVKDIGDQELKTIGREKEQLLKQLDDMNAKRSQKIGQINELQVHISRCKKVLESPEYRDAIKNYRFAMYELEALKAVQHDLIEYQVALEWALIKFHSEKMEKINQLIREYWRSIYQGNDIDFIQIQTDDFEKSTTKKRNYNYRVVQSKNDVELDMRGRCSAGQRVLACLIIRIALAETFSSNCGVLALDEPTTNLDRVNIISLCEVLTRLIEERRSQANFMLIVITHDEEFVNSLGYMESYYKVCRNVKGKSVIEKCTI